MRAKRDATILALKLQEDAGIDIVTEGEQARQHFVHGFLEVFTKELPMEYALEFNRLIRLEMEGALG